MPWMTTTFQTLRVQGWRQFDDVELALHPRLTIVTGANGAGKSSLLQIFSRHFGFHRPYLATPHISSAGTYTYLAGLFESIWRQVSGQKRDANDVGSLQYSNGVEVSLRVPPQSAVQYNIDISNQQTVLGIHIDSHRAISPYQSVAQIPTNLISPTIAYQSYHGEVHNRYQGGHTGYSPIYRMKEAIISMAMFGEGNSRVQGNPSVLQAYLGFVDALRKILPETLGFVDLAVRTPEIVCVTRSGEFLLDASSGGLVALIDFVWRLYMYSLEHPEFVVTIDEPENHLHPTMQRSLMRRLLSAFPGVRFIIATHSPFVVSSVKDSAVYVLRYRQQDALQGTRVFSERLDTINKAGPASEILREALGVPATIPEWVEEGLAAIVARYRQREITGDTLRTLRQELSTVGYDHLYPSALAALTDGK